MWHHSFQIYLGNKDKYAEEPTLKWSIVKRVPSYSNITKRCRLCLQEKFEIIKYPRPDELLNKRSELISKCRHANKYLLCNYKSKDWAITWLSQFLDM